MSISRIQLFIISKFNFFKSVFTVYLLLTFSLGAVDSVKAKDFCKQLSSGQTNKSIDSLANNKPVWWDNSIGKDEIILPGYTPVTTSIDNKIFLSERVYDWRKSFFPYQITSMGGVLVEQMHLVVKINNKNIPLKPNKVTIEKASSGAYVIVKAIGEPMPGLIVSVETKVEYDGVSISKVSLDPQIPIKVDGFFYEADIVKKPSSQIIAFKAKDIRKQKDRKDFIKQSYAGEFINIIGVSDGDRSFWWFADNAKGWIWNNPNVTELKISESSAKLKQNLIGGKWIINKPMTFNFNFMATPVRHLGSKWRLKYPLIGVPSKQEEGMSGLIKLWWTTAFAHDAFPYTYYPDSLKNLVSENDLKVFPGLIENSKLIKRNKLKYNSFTLPYFSAHALSKLDPNFAIFHKFWQVEPLKVFNEVVGPFNKIYGKPVLTHRAPQYSNYLLWRMNEEIDNLGFDGIYLDHGPPINSCNPLNGGWVDSNQRLQPSLDILALRDFLKRLKVLFHLKGKPGLVLIHNSNREIIPAYSFVYATVNGEQYRSGRVKNGEYLKTLSLGEIRARFSPDQYGVLTVWIPTEWNYHRKERKWVGSDSQLRAYRRVSSLALLHDVLLWPKGSHSIERKKLMLKLQDFGIDKSDFKGYWSFKKVSSKDANLKISAYYRSDKKRYLLIVANISNQDVNSMLNFDISSLFPGQKKLNIIYEGKKVLNVEDKNNQMPIFIPKLEFRWIELSS